MASIIVGGLRSFDFASKTILDRLGEPSDFFLFFTLDIYTDGQLSTADAILPPRLCSAIDAFKPLHVEVRDGTCNNAQTASAIACCTLPPEKRNETLADLRSRWAKRPGHTDKVDPRTDAELLASWRQFSSRGLLQNLWVAMCYEEVRRSEAARGRKYRVVTRLRPDLFAYNALPSSHFAKVRPNEVLVQQGGRSRTRAGSTISFAFVAGSDAAPKFFSAGPFGATLAVCAGSSTTDESAAAAAPPPPPVGSLLGALLPLATWRHVGGTHHSDPGDGCAVSGVRGNPERDVADFMRAPEVRRAGGPQLSMVEMPLALVRRTAVAVADGDAQSRLAQEAAARHQRYMYVYFHEPQFIWGNDFVRSRALTVTQFEALCRSHEDCTFGNGRKENATLGVVPGKAGAREHCACSF